MDPVARLQTALDTVIGRAPLQLHMLQTGVTAPVYLVKVQVAVQLALTVPAMARRSEQVRETGRALTRHAGQLAATSKDVGHVGKQKLPHAIVGATGTSADLCIQALDKGLSRGGGDHRQRGQGDHHPGQCP